KVHFRLSRTCSLSNRIEMRFEKASVAFPMYNTSEIELTENGREPQRLSLGKEPFEFVEAVAPQLRDLALAATEGTPTNIPAEPASLAEAMRGRSAGWHEVGYGGDPEAGRRIQRRGALHRRGEAAAAGARGMFCGGSVAVHGAQRPEVAAVSDVLGRTGVAYGD